MGKKQSLEKLSEIIDGFANSSAQMFYRNSFAISCYLASIGEEKAAKKQLNYLFDVLGWNRRKTYYLNIMDGLIEFAAEYASEIGANAEINKLFMGKV